LSVRPRHPEADLAAQERHKNHADMVTAAISNMRIPELFGYASPYPFP
jgi:hypothetical protein